MRGKVGDTLTVLPARGSAGDWSLELEYRGAATVAPNGVPSSAGTAVSVRFERFEPATAWDVKFFTWTDSLLDPQRSGGNLDAIVRQQPVLARREARLDYQWYRPRIASLPQERWALDATTTVDLPEGEYSLRTISDDAARVWVDGKIVSERLVPGGSELMYAPISGGRHTIRIAFYQLNGWTELRVDILKGKSRSTGSAGPH